MNSDPSLAFILTDTLLSELTLLDQDSENGLFSASFAQVERRVVFGGACFDLARLRHHLVAGIFFVP